LRFETAIGHAFDSAAINLDGSRSMVWVKADAELEALPCGSG
jgi:hypothetical protein